MLVDFTYLFIIMNIPIVFGLHSCGWVFWNPWQTYNDQFSVPEGSEDVGVGSAQSQTHDGQLQRNRGQAGHQWSIFWEKNDSFLLKTFGLSSKFKAKYSPCLVMVYRSRSVRSPFSSPVRRQSLEERSPGNIITEVGHLLLCLNLWMLLCQYLWFYGWRWQRRGVCRWVWTRGVSGSPGCVQWTGRGPGGPHSQAPPWSWAHAPPASGCACTDPPSLRAHWPCRPWSQR